MLTFIGCKIGDVNASSANLASASVRSKYTSKLEVEEQLLMNGQTISIDLKANDVLKTNGFQLSIDIQGIDKVKVNPGIINLEETHYYFSGNYLNLSWSAIEASELKPNDVLFTIEGISTREGKLSEMIEISTERLSNEVYFSENSKQGQFELSFSPLSTSQDINTESLRNIPNPFSNSTSIEFTTEKASEVQFEFYDITGKLIYQIQKNCSKGLNSINISNKELRNTQGVIVCIYKSGKTTSQLRMILTDQ